MQGSETPRPFIDLVFVYGTLRRGECRDLEKKGGIFVTDTHVAGTLYNLGAYPGLRLDGTGRVVGEIYRVTPDLLSTLDEIEGFDPSDPSAGEYIRRMMTIEPADGKQFVCWLYEVTLSRCAGCPIITSGDWLDRWP